MRPPERGTTPIEMGAELSASESGRSVYRGCGQAACMIVDLAGLFTEGSITAAEVVLLAHSITVNALAAATAAHRLAA